MTHPFAEARWGLGPGTPPWHPPPSAGLKGGPNDSTDDVWVVVLAGGQGTRLQQFIRLITGSDRPKQFCRIVGMRTMLRHTWDRACRIVPPDRVVTVITAGQECHLRDEPSGSVPGQILVQPANKETGPGLLLPLMWVRQRSPGATVVVFPADHFIWEEERFLEHVRAAVQSARRFRDRLVVLGVEADAPEQSYGWIARGARCSVGSGVELYRVRRFWEKPDHETAERLLASGHLWNTFVLAGQIDAFMLAAREAMPESVDSLGAAAAFLGTRYEAEVLATMYRGLRPINFSRTMLAGYPELLLVLPVHSVYWSDWGDPQRVLKTLTHFDRRPAWLPTYTRALTQRPELLQAGGR